MDALDHIISLPDVDLHIQTRGENPATVFVHGLGGDLGVWDELWRTLARDALRYDLRGFGGSIARSAEPFNHAEDLLALFDALKIERASLIAVSMGGSIALNFALNHPERVNSLVLISPGLVAWEWSDAWRALWKPIEDSARAGDLDKARDLWWRHPLFATTRDTPAGAALYAQIMRMRAEQWLDDTHRLMMPDVERLHELQARTLLLSGGKDFEDFRLIADLLSASATNLRRIDYPLGGHMLNLEYPDDCARDIAAFLKL